MGRLTFSVDSALLSELGERLVETVHIALLELVKNAYDADATQVTIRIAPSGTGGPEIHVVDNGVGMTYDEVKKYWMRIATTHKRQHDVSARYGRPRTGSKGIGRFSCRRLGNRLSLMTVARKGDKAYERTEVTFDWKAFKPGSDLTTIECPGVRRTVAEAETGTSLLIGGSDADEWTTRGYGFLKRQLAVLVANRGTHRRGFEEDPGFNIEVDAPQFGERIANLREQLIGAGWGTLTAKVDGKGNAVCGLKAMKIGSKTIKYPKRCPDLAGVSLRIGLLVDIKEEMRDKSVLSLGTLNRILKEWGGVYVRHKGFRAHPYGEPDDDWLDIDRDRGLRKGTVPSLLQPFAERLTGVDPQRALLSLLSHTSHVGDVEIGPLAHGFEMKTNREGFVDSPSVTELKQFVRFAIHWATIYRDYFIRRRIEEVSRQARNSLERQLGKEIEPERTVEKALDYVRKEVKSIAHQLPTQRRQEVTKAVATATEAIIRHDESNREELRHLRLVASTSTLLLIFSHEVKSFLGNIEQITVSLGRVARHADDDVAQRVDEIREDLRATKGRFLDLLAMTSLVAVDSRRAQPAVLNLKSRVKKAKQCFSLVTRSYGIDMDLTKTPRDVTVGPLLEAELYAILLNVLSNAIKSVIAGGKAKRIEVAASRESRVTVIRIRDSGLGLDAKHYDDVFVPFVADPDGRLYKGLKARLNPEDEYIVGTGSGLGLSIVKEILVLRKGSIRFVEPKDPWTTELEIRLP
ncbi:MAG: sensor histidine kinase [Candidatus Atribacteria bacterium]|nr:sensor histidine kinase [Candidatus Atribacteria bacterium]